MQIYNHSVVLPLTVGEMGTNCYAISDTETDKCLIIDPGDAPEYIADKIIALGYEPQAIIATHGHFDHILGAFALQKAFNIPFFLNQNDQFMLAFMQKSAKHFLSSRIVDPPPENVQFLMNGSKMKIGTMDFEILCTPGHTPGSICIKQDDDGLLFVGDLFFSDGGLGRTDFVYSDQKKFKTSLTNMLSQPSEYIVFSGHGDMTTIGKERAFHV